MNARGRSRKVKNPEVQCAKSPAGPVVPIQAPPCRPPRKAPLKEKKHGTEEDQKPEKKEQKTPKHIDEKPSVSGIKREKMIGADRGKSPEHFTQKIPKYKKPEKKEQKTPKHIDEKPSVSGIKTDFIQKIPKNEKPETPGCPTKKADVNRILSETLKELTIKKEARSKAAGIINTTIKTIMDHMEKKTECFKDVKDLRTGSYYELLKISNPDEFDVMLTIPIDRVAIQPFKDDGAFYSVALKRGKTPLDPFRQEDNTLPASEILKNFRGEVMKSVKTIDNLTVEKKKKGCPAVTLLITGVGTVPISLDVVLGIEVQSSWPNVTKDGFEVNDWLGRKVKQEFKRKPYYLVPKYKGRGTEQVNGILTKDIWRISFSHVEKAILKSHGSDKTCCEGGKARCCRFDLFIGRASEGKDCLKLLKHLLSLLKEKDSSFHDFYSYLAKTTLFHACCSRTKDSDWEASRLVSCFRLLLEDFEGHLRCRMLPNFFIPTQNLLFDHSSKSCTSLADRIKDERDKGFPIFLK